MINYAVTCHMTGKAKYPIWRLHAYGVLERDQFRLETQQRRLLHGGTLHLFILNQSVGRHLHNVIWLHNAIHSKLHISVVSLFFVCYVILRKDHASTLSFLIITFSFMQARFLFWIFHHALLHMEHWCTEMLPFIDHLTFTLHSNSTNTLLA